MKARKKESIDIVAGIIIILFCLLMFWGLTFIPYYTGVNLPAILWPRLILGLMIIFAFMLILAGLRNFYLLSISKTKIGFESVQNNKNISNIGRLIKIILLIFIYNVVIYLLGFCISTPFFISFFMWLLGERNKKLIVLTALAIDLLFIILFGRIVGSPLPRGKGVFWELSLLMY